jgi:hypothetical protein
MFITMSVHQNADSNWSIKEYSYLILSLLLLTKKSRFENRLVSDCNGNANDIIFQDIK